MPPGRLAAVWSRLPYVDDVAGLFDPDWRLEVELVPVGALLRHAFKEPLPAGLLLERASACYAVTIGARLSPSFCRENEIGSHPGATSTGSKPWTDGSKKGLDNPLRLWHNTAPSPRDALSRGSSTGFLKFQATCDSRRSPAREGPRAKGLYTTRGSR
jgi:hypothetical protein